MDRPLHFVSGLPRSGSTLLMNLLGQNPSLHVTPTSGLIHLMRQVVHRWPNTREFRSQGLENARPFVLNGLRGLLSGFYQDQFEQGQTVFDKSRGWLQYIEPLEEILARRVKVITMVRDVRAIAASFEKLYRGRGIEGRVPSGPAAVRTATSEQRARHLLAASQVVGRSLSRVRDAIDRCPDRLLIIPYPHFTLHPQQTLSVIHQAFDLPPFDYDPDHVAQVTHEDDNYHGRQLHTIRPKIEAPPAEPWRGILPDSLCKQLEQEYADLNALAAGEIWDPGATA
ncbi:MAG: hypothetical protein GTO53_07045, partial [Planctomycetales bacterium]|nr:hypothetical protein [Planctomycetales bacterium]NIM08892.1 hypothetical protein [Planctomycetales bacterium]NIN08352.1 hypothetical protein [Planctomycetales bacterium]NIN77480.1 hypothetical protein [Planctomycetales bacterium]NIO34652.1 hypothetical protein [Planctomycetales bacterium]